MVQRNGYSYTIDLYNSKDFAGEAIAVYWGYVNTLEDRQLLALFLDIADAQNFVENL